jgi:hypothetical protein
VLTAAEQHQVTTLPADKGRDLLKHVRTQLPVDYGATTFTVISIEVGCPVSGVPFT